MACDDCEDCSKRSKCTQPYSYDCPFNKVEEYLPYLEILKDIKKNLVNSKELIMKNRKESYDLEDIERNIDSLIYDIEESTNKDIIEEYNQLYNKNIQL